MKLSEIPGIGDICDMELSEIRQKVSSEMKKNKDKYEALKDLWDYLYMIEEKYREAQKAFETAADKAETTDKEFSE